MRRIVKEMLGVDLPNWWFKRALVIVPASFVLLYVILVKVLILLKEVE